MVYLGKPAGAFKKFISNGFCDFFTNAAINLKRKSFLLRDFVWCKNGTKPPLSKEKFLFRAVKEADILRELKKLKRKKATGPRGGGGGGGYSHIWAI